MPVGGNASYFLRGHKPEADGDTLEEALAALQREWTEGSAWLRPHDMGNLVITLRIGSEEVSFEITNPDILDSLRESGPQSVMQAVIKELGFGEAVGEQILARTAAHLEVDTFRDPSAPDAWQPGVTFDRGMAFGAPPMSQELPPAVPRMVGELLREEDVERKRGVGRRRSKLATGLINEIVKRGREEGLSDAKLAKQYGLPRTTVRDVRHRQERRVRVRKTLGVRPAGKQLTKPQRSTVLAEIRRQKGNASAAARELGLPARTVREIRQRAAEASTPRATPRVVPTGGSHSASVRSKVLAGVRSGMTPTAAGRAAGVAGRTARGWVRSERLTPKSKK